MSFPEPIRRAMDAHRAPSIPLRPMRPIPTSVPRADFDATFIAMLLVLIFFVVFW